MDLAGTDDFTATDNASFKAVHHDDFQPQLYHVWCIKGDIFGNKNKVKLG